jgi:hypothetical protein
MDQNVQITEIDENPNNFNHDNQLLTQTSTLYYDQNSNLSIINLDFTSIQSLSNAHEHINFDQNILTKRRGRKIGG